MSSSSIEWNLFIERLFELATPYLGVRADFLHIRIAHEYSVKLLSEEGGDCRIVEPAVILHDVGWSELPPEQIGKAYGVRAKGKESKRLNRIHEVKGAALAAGLLQSIKYSPQMIEQITLIIERHDSGKSPESVEEKIVKDSDKLWRFSRTGFWTEVERQGVEAFELYSYLKDRRPALYCSTSVFIAEEEIGKRAEEIAGNSGPTIAELMG